MKKTVIMLVTLAVVAPALRAHEGHVHEAALEAAPHGGILRDATPFKAEAVLNGDVVRIYVYDKELKPVALDQAQAKGDVQFPRQKSKSVTFLKKDGFYEAAIPGISKVHRYDLHVNLLINKVKALADFGIDNIQ
jgi:hypothetical protein